MKTQRSNRPTHAVYVVEGDGENAFWHRIGSAWAHQDNEGYNVVLTSLPIDGRLVVRKPKEQEDAA